MTLLATVSAAAAGTTPAADACGVAQVGGVAVRTWCGSATATVTWAGKTMVVKGGSCDVTKVAGMVLVTVNTGRYTVPPAKPKARAFSAGGSDLKAGTILSWLISFQTPGKPWTLRPSKTTVTITKGARKGTFSGVLYGGGKVKGSWTC